ncbi:unnamed protein product, partial [Rotaria socialis]
MSTPRFQHIAALLPSGKILVAGGISAPFSEAYDPTSNTWTPVTKFPTFVLQNTATLLSSDKVLVTGGFNGWDQ